MNKEEDTSRLHIDPDMILNEDESSSTKEQKQDAEEKDTAPTLQEVIKEQATEDESPLSKNFTLKKILGGDIFNTSTIRKQIWLMLLICFFLIVYISNRYSCQQSLIEIDKLTKELQDAKYRALSTSSQLTERTRESHVLDMLRTEKDSSLHIADQPPYLITVPEK